MSSRMTSLQGLRCLAALLVVIDHSIEALVRRNVPIHDLMPISSAIGGLGVTIFFVISGFVMVIATRDGFARPGAGRSFLLRRLVRIAPLYWVMTIVAFVLFAGRTWFDWEMLAKSFAFIPMLNLRGYVTPTLSVGWTLNYEIFFYAVFAIGLMFPRRLGLGLVSVVILALSFIGIVFEQQIRLPYGAGTFLTYYVHPIMQYFVFGIWLAWIYTEYPRVRGRLPVALVAVLHVGLVVLAVCALPWVITQKIGIHFVYVPIAVVTVLLAAVAGEEGSEGRLTHALSSGGDASYSLYLTHVFLVGPLSFAWTRVAPTAIWPLFLPISMAVCMTVGLITYRRVEVPILRELRRRLALR